MVVVSADDDVFVFKYWVASLNKANEVAERVSGRHWLGFDKGVVVVVVPKGNHAHLTPLPADVFGGAAAVVGAGGTTTKTVGSESVEMFFQPLSLGVLSDGDAANSYSGNKQ